MATEITVTTRHRYTGTRHVTNEQGWVRIYDGDKVVSDWAPGTYETIEYREQPDPKPFGGLPAEDLAVIGAFDPATITGVIGS